MTPRKTVVLIAASALAVALAAPVSAQPTIEVVAEGLHAPRGLAVAGDGSLLVAEAGQAGDVCPEMAAGFCFGASGSIAHISDGSVERIIEGLPSSGSGPELVGPSDVAMVDEDHFYVVVNSGADPAMREGLPPEMSAMGWLVMGSSDGSSKPVADVAGFESTDDPDAEYSGGVPDANPHSVALAADGSVVVADAGQNALLGVDDAGTVSLITLFPPREHLFSAELMAAMGPPPEVDGEMAAEGEAMAEGAEMGEADEMAEAPPEGAMVPVPVESVPTAVVLGPDGAYYVGELTGGPFPVGGASVWRVVPGEEPTEYATGLTNIMDLGFGPDGTLYVAEIVHEGLMPLFMGGDVAPIGAVMSVPSGGGAAAVLATGPELMALGGLAVGDDGAIYVSANTLGPEGGTVVKITP